MSSRRCLRLCKMSPLRVVSFTSQQFHSRRGHRVSKTTRKSFAFFDASQTRRSPFNFGLMDLPLTHPLPHGVVAYGSSEKAIMEPGVYSWAQQ